MADFIKVKSKTSGAVKSADEIYGMLPQDKRVQGEDANAYATRLAKEHPDRYEVASTPAPPSLGGFVSNLGSDVKELATGMLSIPGAVKDLAMTPYNLYTGETTPDKVKATAGNIWDVFKNQYSQYYGPLASGDFQKFGSNIYDHPGQILQDIATVATAGEAGAALAARAGVAGAKGTARVLGKIATVTDPITAGVKVGQQAAKVATKIPAVNNAVTKLYSWGLDQNLPDNVLGNAGKAKLAQKQTERQAKTALEYGIPLNQKGLDKAESIQGDIHQARGSAVENAPGPIQATRIDKMIEPHLDKLFEGGKRSIGSDIEDLRKAIDKQFDVEARGSMPIQKGQPDIPFHRRNYDPNDFYKGESGDLYRPHVATPEEMHASVQQGNNDLRALYKKLNTVPNMEEGYKAAAQKAILEAYREKLDKIIGDVQVPLSVNGKTITKRFKDLGVDESRLFDLGDTIHRSVYTSGILNNTIKALGSAATGNAATSAASISKLLHSPEIAAKLALFVKGTNPSTMFKTRVATSAAHIAPKTKTIPQQATPWNNEINPQATPWDNEIGQKTQ